MPVLLLAAAWAVAQAHPGLDALPRLDPPGVVTAIDLAPARATAAPGRVVDLVTRDTPGVLRSILIEPGPDGGAARLSVRIGGAGRPILGTTLDALAEARPVAGSAAIAERVGGLYVVRLAVPYAFGLRIGYDGEPPRLFRASLQEGATEAPPLPEADAEPARLGEPAEYPVEAAARSASTFVLPPGPRTIRLIEVAPAPGTAEAWRTARLRLIWEGDDPGAPGVDVPLGLAFGRFDGAGLGRTLLAGPGEGDAWRNRMPMPYRTQGLLRIDADRPIAGRLRLRSTAGVAPGSGYLRGASTPPADDGRGRLIGLVAGRPPDPSSARFSVDGRPAVTWAEGLGLPPATGGGPLAGDLVGWLRAPGPEKAGVAGLYRWLAADPISYDRGVRVEGASGRPEGPGRGVEVVTAWFWYSKRPGSGPRPAAPR